MNKKNLLFELNQAAKRLDEAEETGSLKEILETRVAYAVAQRDYGMKIKSQGEDDE